MPPSLHLSVPADARYRVLAPEAANKYATLAGCDAEDAQAFQSDVERAAAGLAVAGGDIALVFAATEDVLTATLTSGAQSSTVSRALSDLKS